MASDIANDPLPNGPFPASSVPVGNPLEPAPPGTAELRVGEALRLWDQSYYRSQPIPLVKVSSTRPDDWGGDTWRALLWYADGTVRFRHRCGYVEIDGVRHEKVIAPALTVPGHVVTDGPQPTVNPSILCPDCGTHGFIQQGRWRSA